MIVDGFLPIAQKIILNVSGIVCVLVVDNDFHWNCGSVQ
jgi:hypothetical protein